MRKRRVLNVAAMAVSLIFSVPMVTSADDSFLAAESMEEESDITIYDLRIALRFLYSAKNGQFAIPVDYADSFFDEQGMI